MSVQCLGYGLFNGTQEKVVARLSIHPEDDDVDVACCWLVFGLATRVTGVLRSRSSTSFPG